MIVRYERPPDEWPDVNQREEPFRDPGALQTFGITLAAHVDGAWLPQRHFGKEVLLAAPVFVIGKRHAAHLDAAPRVLADRHEQTIGVRKRHRTQQHGVHRREDRGRRADAEREGQRSRDREPWLALQRADGVAQVLAQAVQEAGGRPRQAAVRRRRDGQLPPLALSQFGLGQVVQCEPPRLGAGPAVAHEFGDTLVEMQRQLVDNPGLFRRWRFNIARRRRNSCVHSDMFELRDAADGVDEVGPRAAVRSQLLAPERREFVEPAPALTRALDPAP